MQVIHRILAATDFSDFSKDALDMAVSFAGAFEADIYLIHVFEPSYFSPGGVLLSVLPGEVHGWIRSVREEESRKLEALAEKMRGEVGRVETLFKTGMPHEEIVSAAEAIPADLIVLGTHGRSGAAHLLLGSVAERVARKAACPVLTVKPRSIAPSKAK
jgi:nucleotide-binding universal stress UspA family protein